jgi:hypothetical protein
MASVPRGEEIRLQLTTSLDAKKYGGVDDVWQGR